MSEKSTFFPLPTTPSARLDREPGDGPEQVGSFIRRIQADAEQICTDAVDIEDARFLAADILEVCRRFVSDGNACRHEHGTIEHSESWMSSVGPATAPDGADNPEVVSARARLENLSTRELEIFTGLAEGYSAAEIATRLSRSTKTVNNHRTRILQKLGLKNSAELVRLALKSGLVTI